MVAVIGPNGAGKSTLVRALAGVVPLDDGRVVCDGESLGRPGDADRDRGAAGSGWSSRRSCCSRTSPPLGNVAFGPRSRGVAAGRAEARRPGLADPARASEDLADRRPAQLSGGQAQRVAIARALADRAAAAAARRAALRPRRRASRWRCASSSARHLADFDGVSVLVTHDALDAMTVANRVLVIDDGRVAQDGTPAEVARQPATDHVARLVGLNVLRGTSSGTSIRLADGTTLVSTTPARGEVSACFSPSAVTLTVGEPHGSARNRWPGRVTSVAPHGVGGAGARRRGRRADRRRHPRVGRSSALVPGRGGVGDGQGDRGLGLRRAVSRASRRVHVDALDPSMSDASPLSTGLSAAHEAPDRNLALELVRVTEAAAMAAGRWVGRGDKNGADGVAVNAMRALISTVGMRGVVVIGEGEKDNAPMLFNGEQVGDGTGPECDVAVDPIDGTTLTAKGMTNADRRAGGRPARLDVRPVRGVLHGEAGHRPRGRRRRRHPLPGRREHPPGRQGQGQRARGRHRRAARPAAPRRSWSTRSARPAPGSSSSPTATSPARSWPPAPAPASTCCSASAAPPRASSPPAR